MKKLSLILNVVLVVAVAVLYIFDVPALIKSDNSPGNNSVPTSPAPTEGIVYINVDSVLADYDMYTDLTTELQATVNLKEAEFQSKQRKFEVSVNDFQNKISKGLVTRTEAAEIEQNLGLEQQKLAQLQQQMQYDLGEESQVAQRKVLNAIMEYLKGLEDKQQYQFVLGNTFGGNVFYANENLNITNSVIEGLNQAYQESKDKE